jgi:hypothetical protein
LYNKNDQFTISSTQDTPTSHAFRYGFTKTDHGITGILLDSWTRSDSIVQKDNQAISEFINIAQSYIKNEKKNKSHQIN